MFLSFLLKNIHDFLLKIKKKKITLKNVKIGVSEKNNLCYNSFDKICLYYGKKDFFSAFSDRNVIQVKNIIENYVTKCLQNQFVLIRYKHTILSCHIKQKSVQIN